MRGGPDQAQANLGESWEFSTLAGSESRVDGLPLSAALGHALPFLAKLIDTRLALSIQVHPDDDASTGEAGKEEAWIVLDADPGAHALVGLRPGVDAEQLARVTREAVAEPARGAALSGLLRRIDVERGSILLVPARTVHAIGGGILLAEIQQPSDCTYRLFDYGSGRPLHVEEALRTVSTDAKATVWRAGDEATPLVGKRLELHPCPPGRHEFDAARTEQLVVVVGEPVQILAPEPRPLAAGDLRLCVGGSFALEVGAGGLAVVGSLPRPFVP